MAKKLRLPIRHIGNVFPICGSLRLKDQNAPAYESKHMSLRTDLGYERYLQLGLVERFKDEKPYRICERCLEIIAQKEGKKHIIRKKWNIQ